MSDVLFEGKTVEEAIELACKELGVPREQLKIEIVSSGSTGVFGLGVKKAKIKVTQELPEEIAVEEGVEEGAEEGVKPEKIVGELVERLGFDLTIEKGHENEMTVFNLSGKDAGLLIGRQGQTIDALQYLLNKILSKGAGEKMQVILNCEGYREKRKAFLTELAARLKERVQKTGKSSYTELLNAADRRIIHVVLQNDPVVRTKSIGDGFLKKVLIYARSHETSGSRSPQ